MGQSLNKIYVHLVFSTKYRKPLITDSIKDELFSYLGGICKNMEYNPIQVGGYKNHVHILCLLWWIQENCINGFTGKSEIKFFKMD